MTKAQRDSNVQTCHRYSELKKMHRNDPLKIVQFYMTPNISTKSLCPPLHPQKTTTNIVVVILNFQKFGIQNFEPKMGQANLYMKISEYYPSLYLQLDSLPTALLKPSACIFHFSFRCFFDTYERRRCLSGRNPTSG